LSKRGLLEVDTLDVYVQIWDEVVGTPVGETVALVEGKYQSDHVDGGSTWEVL